MQDLLVAIVYVALIVISFILIFALIRRVEEKLIFLKKEEIEKAGIKMHWILMKKYSIEAIIETLEENEEFDEVLLLAEEKRNYTKVDLANLIYDEYFTIWHESYSELANILKEEL